MTKLRVYEIAKDLGMDNKALVALLQSVGVSEARNHMSAIAPEAVERVKRHLEKQKVQGPVVEERIRPTVVKRRAVGRPGDASAPAHSRPVAPPEHHEEAAASAPAPSAPYSAPAPEMRSSPMSAPMMSAPLPAP